MGTKKEVSDDYELIDSGGGRKLERFGRYLLVRPCAQAIWPPQLSGTAWDEADAVFERKPGKGWQVRTELPASWNITVDGIRFMLTRTDFGHLGIFPEQRPLWRWVQRTVKEAFPQGRPEISVLNLFAYSGGATLAAAKSGAEVCHLDASKGMVRWARENAALNSLTNAPIRWIVDDVNKFLDRELKRGRRYDAVILDPPTYGHGKNDEVYKIEDELTATVRKCWELLSDAPLFLLLSSHTPACTPQALANIFETTAGFSVAPGIETGEMLLTGRTGVLPVPSGTWCRWSARAEG